MSGPRPGRGRIGVYALAFVLLAGSGYVQARGNLQSSLVLVWVSIALSGLAVAAAVASVLLRRERRSGPAAEEPSSGDRSGAG